MIKVNNNKVKINHYPDGALNIKGMPDIKDTVLIQWHFESNEEYMALAFLTKYFHARGVRVILYMPYVPNGRMDRVEKADDIFTLKYFGELINDLNFEKVIVSDVHSSVTIACIDRCWYGVPITTINSIIQMITDISGDKPSLFFSDEGAMKRYLKYFKMPYAFGVKNRQWETGEIKGLCIVNDNNCIRNKDILIIDDICSKGGTVYHSAKRLKEMGARNIYLYITHCENTILQGELINSGLIKHIYTTNSIYTVKHKDITVFENTDICINSNNITINYQIKGV